MTRVEALKKALELVQNYADSEGWPDLSAMVKEMEG
jgi:hypothetical protein